MAAVSQLAQDLVQFQGFGIFGMYHLSVPFSDLGGERAAPPWFYRNPGPGTGRPDGIGQRPRRPGPAAPLPGGRDGRRRPGGRGRW